MLESLIDINTSYFKVILKLKFQLNYRSTYNFYNNAIQRATQNYFLRTEINKIPIETVDLQSTILFASLKLSY